MAASMKDAISSYCSGNPDDAAKQLASEINKSTTKFVEFVENLGEFLTSTDTVVRGRATQLIGDVLNMLPPSFLTKEQAEVVAAFLLSKLADHHSVQPHALQALSVLTSRCNPLPDGLPEQICRTIFREVQNQTLTHADRRATYLTLQNLLGSSWKALEQMGGDFVIGFIQQMDAEKDPRNLTICFNCAHFICSNSNLGPFAEEMFEVLGCYFPIDFTPPPTDPHGITKEELTEGLRKCMAASAEFAEYCLPLLLEKMTSDLQTARLDAFLTLAACAPVYGGRGLTEFLGQITSSVKREVLMSLSADLVNAAKGAIKAVYTAFTPPSQVDTNKDNTLTTSITELYQDISKYLDGTDIKKSCLAYSLCHAVASSSPFALSVIMSLVLPSLVNSCQKELMVPERLALLKELREYLELFRQLQSNENVVQILKSHLPSVFALYESLIKQDNKDLQLESVQALTVLFTSGLCVTGDKYDQFIDVLVKKSVGDIDPLLRSQLLSSLQSVIKQNPESSPKIIETLMQLMETANSKYAAETLIHAVRDVDSFIKISDFLLNTISQALMSDNVSPVIDYTEALSQLLTFQSGDEVCMAVVAERVAEALLRIAVTSTLHWTEETKDQCAAFMSSLKNILIVIGCSLKKSDVTVIWDKLQKLMLDGDTNSINLSGDFKTISPLQPGSPWQQTQLIALLEGFIIGGDIRAMIEKREVLFEAVFRLAVETEDDFSHASACRCLAAIFNKAPIGSEIQWLLEPLLERLRSITANSGSVASKQRALNVWVWMTKAMECRAHSATGLLSTHLFTLLADPQLGPMVADRVGLVVEDMNDIFTARLNGNITPLYKQRFFALNFKAILDGYHKATSKAIKQNYLTAISHITSNLPLQVMKPHFATLVPLLLLSLESPDAGNHIHTLTTLCSAMQCAPDVIASGADSLIPRLLHLTKNSLSMKERIEALKCLESLATLPSHVVAPHQTRVVHELASSLDDKKRLVRKQAVETRSSWILLEEAPK